MDRAGNACFVISGGAGTKSLRQCYERRRSSRRRIRTHFSHSASHSQITITRQPTKFPELGLMQLVARGVAVQFRQPPFAAVRRRRAVLATLMPMPKAAVDEDGGFVFRQKDVGTR